MKRVLEIFVEGHRLKTNECDEEIYQSGQFLDECAGIILPLKILTQVNPFQELTCCCLNPCMHDMAGDKQLAIKCQWSVVKLLLLMSHGQSTVNRGFSVNKEVAVENPSERSFVVTLN